MPLTSQNERHTEDMQDIITAAPSWVLRFGITLFFFILVMLICLSAFIRYPDIVKAQLTIDSPNSPKPIDTKISGKLTKLLVEENAEVKEGQILAYLESTAKHEEVLALSAKLTNLQKQLLRGGGQTDIFLNTPINLQLGELQASYQTFYQAYLTYKSAISNGFYLKKRNYLEHDLSSIENEKKQLLSQKAIQQRDLELATEQYEMHKKLAEQRVEAKMELKANESIYLSKKSPLIQTESALITSNDSYVAKQKEILELDNTIAEEKLKFTQALNSLISDIDGWKSKYVLSASQSGKVSFAGIIQENQVLNANQEVFYINPGNEQFYGDMNIPQGSMGKVRVGQQVLVKLRSYPYEEYGMLRGQIKYISDVPFRDSIFVSRVNFKLSTASDIKKPIHLKTGMAADAEIITQDATLFSRISRNVIKILK